MRGRKSGGDFFIVLSFDKKTNNYYLEMYRWSNKDVIDKQFILESKHLLDISVELDDTRANASILIQEFNLQTNTFVKHQIVLLNSYAFSVTSPSQNNKATISNGMRVIESDQLPKRQPSYEYSKLLQKFMFDKTQEPIKIKLKLFFQSSGD